MRKLLLIIIMLGITGCAHIGELGRSGQYVDLEALPLADQKHYQLSLYYIESGHYQVAEKKLKQLVANHPTFPDVYNGLGVISERRGQVTQAADYFLQAIQFNPDYETAIKNYGALICYVEGGDGIISVAKDHYPRVKSRLYSEAARCYIEESQWQKAAEALDEALQLDSDYADSYLLKAKIDFRAARYHDAEEAIFRFNDLHGYTEESARLALLLAQKRGDQVDIDRYKNVLVEQFKVSK